jgi:hypothetical protein
MTLEALLSQLSLTTHTAKLSEWRDALQRDHAAELQVLDQALQSITSERDTIAAQLLEHQTLTDQGMAAAGPLVTTLAAMEIPQAIELAAIFAQFAQFSSHRAVAKAAAAVAEARAALEKAVAEAAAVQL